MGSELSGSNLRRAVFALIRRELGAQTLVRFIAEYMSGKGDYTKERQEAEQPTIDDIVSAQRRKAFD